eukprot:Stramenopile-MAST_4_protein_689
MSDDSTATLLTFLYRLNSAFSRATISGGAWYNVFPSPEKETLVWDVLSDNDEFTAGSMARLVAYDIVKYCPSSRLDVWERVFVGIQRDFTRADHPDHTVAALSTLSVLPVRMFLQFLCTANVESTMIGLVQNEACKFIRLTSIEALGDLLLRACAKLSAEDGDALKSRSYESISEEKRTRHAIFDRVLLVWKQIARSAEDDDIAIAAASFRAINRLFREGYQASLTAVDDEFGLNAVGVRDRLLGNCNRSNTNEGDSVRARLRCSLTCIFESDAWMAELMSIAVSVPSAKHLFSAYARCLSPGLNPLRCREEIAMTFLLTWTNTYYRMFADASQTPSAEGVSAAWSLLEHFRCVLEWPAAPIEKLETGVKGEASTSVHAHGSPTAHLYVDILELILPQISLLAEYTNLESTSMIIMEYALQLENIAAPTIRIRILSSLLRFWVSYRHESTTSLDVGAALTKGIHDEFEGFFGSQEIFSVKHSCRRKASTKRIDESSVERMLFLIPCLLVVLESQERDDCSVCASIRREVSKTIEYIQSVEDLGVKNTFWQHSFAKSILLQELKRLLHFGTKTFSRGSIPSIPGEAHLIFQCDKCFPEHVLGPEFEYYSAMQMHVFSHGGCQQEKKVRGFETDKPWKQALSLSGFMPTCIDSTIHLFGNEAKKREISKLVTPTAFFATPISMQNNQWNLGGQGYCSLNGPNDPVIVKMRHLFSPHTNEILIFSQLFSMMNFSPEVCMRLQLSVSMDGVMLPGNSKLEHTFDGPIGPCCVLQFDTVLKLRCFGTVTIIPLVSICDQRIATRSDKHQSTAGFPRNNVTTDSIGKLKFQSPCADVGAGGEMGKTTDHTATGIAACADKGPGGTSVSASPSGIALVQNHFEVELSSEESADGGFDDESSVNHRNGLQNALVLIFDYGVVWDFHFLLQQQRRGKHRGRDQFHTC